MDPLIAALSLANTIAQIVLLSIQAQPPEVRAEYAKAQLEDFQRWREFLSHFLPKGPA
jgi:hypothetical protein